MSEEEEKDEVPDQSRREFASKLIMAAGAVAAAGLLAGTGDAQAYLKEAMKLEYKEMAQFKFMKLEKGTGFRMVFRGPRVGEALQQMGVSTAGADPERVAIEISFSW
jgi:hypothetical protein